MCGTQSKDLMMLRGNELEGLAKYPCGDTKIHSIRKDQVFKLELRSVISDSVALEINSSHCCWVYALSCGAKKVTSFFFSYF